MEICHHGRYCQHVAESVLKLGTRIVEETKEPIDSSDRISEWLRLIPSLPAFTSYIHYPPPTPARRSSSWGPWMVHHDDKKERRRVTADDITSTWPRRFYSPIPSLWNSLYLSLPSPPPPQFPGTYRHDLNVFTALWDEHMNTDVRPPPLTCVTDSSYEYLGLRLIDNPCHYSTEWSETLNPWIKGNSSTPEL